MALFPCLVLAGPDSSTAINVALERRATGTFYVPGEIRGYGELQLLLDTGSSYTVIGEDILKALVAEEAAQFSREVRGSMADGRPRVVPLYRIKALRLGDRCWVHEIEAAVMAEGTRAILGMDVLSRLAPFTFSAQPAEIVLSQCQSQSLGEVAEVSAAPSQPALTPP